MNEKYEKKPNEKSGSKFNRTNNNTAKEKITDPVRKKYLI